VGLCGLDFGANTFFLVVVIYAICILIFMLLHIVRYVEIVTKEIIKIRMSDSFFFFVFSFYFSRVYVSCTRATLESNAIRPLRSLSIRWPI